MGIRSCLKFLIMSPPRIVLLSLALLLIFRQSLVQSKHFLVETKDNSAEKFKFEDYADDNKLTEKELSAVLGALSKGNREVYEKLNSTDKNRFEKKIRSAYGQDLEKMKESAKDGSMLKLFTGGKESPALAMGCDFYECCGCHNGCGCGCFSGTSRVKTERREIPIGKLRLGDKVLTYTPEKGAHYTEFLGWLDRAASAGGEFLKIWTNSSSIVLTGNHVIFRLSAVDGGLESVFADQIEEGDRLVSWKGSGVREESVVAVELAREKGIWTPLTMEGTLLVDGLLASSYASFPHSTSDLVLAPVKRFPRLLLDDEESQHEDGLRDVVRLMKKMATAVGLRQRNQGEKEDPRGSCPSDKAQLAAGGFSKYVEL